MVSGKYRDLSSGPAKICRRGLGVPAWDYSQPTANETQGYPADRTKKDGFWSLRHEHTIQYDLSINLN